MEKLLVNLGETFGLVKLDEDQKVKDLGIFDTEYLIEALKMGLSLGSDSVNLGLTNHIGFKDLEILVITPRNMKIGERVAIVLAPRKER